MLTRASVWYGNSSIRVASDGFCAFEMWYIGDPIFRRTSHVHMLQGKSKLLLWVNHNKIITDSNLVNYSGSLKILKVKVSDWDLNVLHASLNIEGVDYWTYLKGNWETMDGVPWELYTGTF